MQKKILWIIFILLASVSILAGETRVYQEKEGTRVTTHFFSIVTVEDGFSVDLKSETPEGPIFQKYRLDKNLGTLSWEFESAHENIKVNAERENNRITMKGTDRGKPIDKRFKINKLPWNQTFNIGLEAFLGSTKRRMYFWAIGVGGPGNMKITKFKVKRKDIESVYLEKTNKKVEAEHVTISLSGLLSMFWTGHYWFRKSDGKFLRYRGKNKPGGPVALMELISD